jgi:hypothetical protein
MSQSRHTLWGLLLVVIVLLLLPMQNTQAQQLTLLATEDQSTAQSHCSNLANRNTTSRKPIVFIHTKKWWVLVISLHYSILHYCITELLNYYITSLNTSADNLVYHCTQRRLDHTGLLRLLPTLDGRLRVRPPRQQRLEVWGVQRKTTVQGLPNPPRIQVSPLLSC